MFVVSDIDECTESTSSCNLAVSKCVNKQPGYTCQCQKGYKKLENGTFVGKLIS